MPRGSRRLRGHERNRYGEHLIGNTGKARDYYATLVALADESDSERPKFQGAKAFPGSHCPNWHLFGTRTTDFRDQAPATSMAMAAVDARASPSLR